MIPTPWSQYIHIRIASYKDPTEQTYCTYSNFSKPHGAENEFSNSFFKVKTIWLQVSVLFCFGLFFYELFLDCPECKG